MAPVASATNAYVSLTKPRGGSIEFGAVAALLEWRFGKGKNVPLTGLVCVMHATGHPYTQHFREGSDYGVVRYVGRGFADDFLTIVCRSPRCVEMLLRILRLHYYDRHAGTEDGVLAVRFVGGTHTVFATLAAFDTWLPVNRHMSIAELKYEALWPFGGESDGSYRLPGPGRLKVNGGRVIATASGPLAADTLNRLLYLAILDQDALDSVVDG